MGLSFGVLVTYVMSSLQLELDYIQMFTVYVSCWLGTAALGAITAAACHRLCTSAHKPRRPRRGAAAYLTLPLVGPAAAVLLATLLLAIPSPPQCQVRGPPGASHPAPPARSLQPPLMPPLSYPP